MRSLSIVLVLLTFQYCSSGQRLQDVNKKSQLVRKIIDSCNLQNQVNAYYRIIIPVYQPKIKPDSNSFNVYYTKCSYQWDKVFGAYPYDMRIEILGQLLDFENDTTKSGKVVCRYGYSKLSAPQTLSYTTQVESLYIVTLLSMAAYSQYYSPYPVLIDTRTGREINNDAQKMKEVYAIYKTWFQRNKKSRFIDYEAQLKGSPFQWYGAYIEKDYIFSDTFRIHSLEAATTTIGVCRN